MARCRWRRHRRTRCWTISWWTRASGIGGGRFRFEPVAHPMRFLFAVAVVVVGAVGAAAGADGARTITVAADGSGDFRTVQSAIDSVPEGNAGRIVIHLRPGTYKEKIRLARAKPFVTLLGDDAKTTVLTNDWNAGHVGPDGKAVGTSGSYSVQIE